ncbi:MAG TPA: CocE/NonD family hydrolase [Terriglobales bacterium]|nr:CocE/NonD family hydrolase [Terriglobales bacterium]
MRSSRLRLFVLAVIVLTFVSAAMAEKDAAPFDIKTNYTKYEYRIPMRDGVKLFTAVYVPKDSSRPYPFLVSRTPYGVAPYGEDRYPKHLGPTEDFARAGYIFVLQDVRGRYQSEGEFVEMRPHIDHPQTGQTDESTDMYDTVDWLLKHVPNNNGKVGIWGISYGGFFTSSSIIDSHPAIKAASPEAPMTNEFQGDDVYHGGAFMLNGNYEFYSAYFRQRAGLEFPPDPWPEFQYGTTDGYDYFLQHGPDLTSIAVTIKNPLFDANYQHNTYDDYWRARDISQHMHGIKCAVLTVGGWFDAEDLSGPIRTYHAIETGNPGISNTLVVGPWAHGQWAWGEGKSMGRVPFNSATVEFYKEHIIFPFFEHYLKGKDDPMLSEAFVFETGSNVWRQYDAWPPKNAQQKTIYLHANGRLSFDPPAANEAALDEYVSDPAHPVPFVSYTTLNVPQEYMVSDQRFASKRPDVLTYVSEPLTDDVTIAGPVSPKLHVATSGTDSDFDVKLIDVYPPDYDKSLGDVDETHTDVPIPREKMGGYQQLVRGEPMRAKFRNSLSKPEPMTPNQITPLNFEMQDVNHTFRRGHRIMVQIQSSWFPLTDLNPQKFVDTAKAKPADFTKATERVYHTPQAASGIVVGVVPQP